MLREKNRSGWRAFENCLRCVMQNALRVLHRVRPCVSKPAISAGFLLEETPPKLPIPLTSKGLRRSFATAANS
jgi:hypothetical protein